MKAATSRSSPSGKTSVGESLRSIINDTNPRRVVRYLVCARQACDKTATANRTAEFLGVKFYKKHMNEQELANSFTLDCCV